MMEETSTENAKISDSGYSNTCSNSQSQRSSSDSFISRNSNLSESSGYGGRGHSTFGSRPPVAKIGLQQRGVDRLASRENNDARPRSLSFLGIPFDAIAGNSDSNTASKEAIPQPISKRKDKDHKKKKSKTISAVNAAADITLKSAGAPQDTVPYNVVIASKPIIEKKSEDIATVELVDATDPGEHNGDTITDGEAGLAPRANPLDDSTSQAHEGFCAVISMHDGLVLYTTPTICTALGYSKDTWIGRSFIDYVHPKDKCTLADQIASGIVSPQEAKPKGINGVRASLFCGLRKHTRHTIYQGNKGQHKEARSNLYLPFHLTLSFRDFRDQAAEQQPRAMFLVVTAQPVHSAYKAPEETIMSSIFTTRHTASCYLSHVDPDVVQYFGYLPQDMVGRSLFDFFHPEDLPFIKDIYETVIRLEGSSFRSKPYRFGVQNGGYVVLETEWSSFINPWTKKLEFVVGQHRVLKGPANPDIFRVPRDSDCAVRNSGISEEVLKEAKIIQGEIRALLDESIQRTSDKTEHDVSKRCKDLASFMESLLQEVKAPGLGKDGVATDDRSFSEHDSVMLGEISPHHEYYDSKSSTETPPSYNQLNYNENIERFFKSKPPVTTMYGSDEENVNSSTDEGGKTSPTSAARKCMSPINGSGASGSGSAENLSSGSNNRTSSASRGDTSNTTSNRGDTSNATTESFKPPTLTESLLNRHNEDMEKLMMQKHREFRSIIKNTEKLKDARIKTAAEKSQPEANLHLANQPHGIKRSATHSWEGDSFKVSKHDEGSRTSTAPQFSGNVTTTVTSMSADQSTMVQTGANINLWPRFSVTVPPTHPAQPCVIPPNANSQAIPRVPILSPMIPVYYVPVQQADDPTTSSSCDKFGTSSRMQPSQTQSAQTTSAQAAHPAQPTQQNPCMFVPLSYVTTAMAGVIYPPVIGAPATGTMMYRPFVVPEQGTNLRENRNPQSTLDNFSDRKRPASQATSIKAEPGSIMAMSESSKKVLSPCEFFSSCLSNDGGCSCLVEARTPVQAKVRRQTDYNGDESSSSSFYSSSFLYKSSDSSCNPDQKPGEFQSEDHSKSHQGMRRKDPPWLDGVQLTPELIYEYQIHPKALSDVLQADMNTLKTLNQPLLVNDQLGQLYLDLEVEGFETKLVLEDGLTSSGSDSGSSNGSWTGTASQFQQKQCRKMVKHGKLVMIHEENAPLPPPLQSQTVPCQEL